jgi:hypothetical protein
MQSTTKGPTSSFRPPPQRGATLPAAKPPNLKRGGVPNLDAAWKRFRVSTARASAGARKGELEMENWGSAGETLERDFTLPKLQVQKSFPLPKYGPVVAGPVLITITGRIGVRGTIALGNSSTVVRLSPGEQKIDFERKFNSSLGEFSLTGGVEPGKASTIGIKLGTQSVEFKFEAGFDFTKPLTLSATPKTPFEGKLQFGDWSFEGKVIPTLQIVVAPNPAWPGWATVARGAGQTAARVIAIGRGLFFAGEIGVATTFGAVAIGVTIAVGAILWVGFCLYMIGQANRDGRALAVGFAFNAGYSDALARMTSDIALLPYDENGKRKYWSKLTYDWKSAYDYWAPRWIDGNDRDATYQIRLLGEIAAIQDQALFLQLYGGEQWPAVKFDHRKKYGEAEGFRAQKYKEIMNRQLRDGKPVGIPLTPRS